MQAQMLAPAAVLVLWTLVMTVWMIVTRFGAFGKAGIDIRAAAPGGRGERLNGVLPDPVMWKAHNLDHLMEQPTIFYALVFYTYLAGGQNEFNTLMAWAYVVLRLAHSLVQATSNTILVRFSLHVLGTLPLFVMAARDVAAMFRA